MDVFAVTILISLVVYVVVGNYAGRRVKNVDDYYVAGRDDAQMLKLTRWVMLGVGLVVLVVGFAVPMDIFWLPVMLLIYSVCMCVFLLWWWTYPYHKAFGQLTASGGIDWLSADVLVNFAGVPMYALMAWLVRRALMKDYQRQA